MKKERDERYPECQLKRCGLLQHSARMDAMWRRRGTGCLIVLGGKFAPTLSGGHACFHAARLGRCASATNCNAGNFTMFNAGMGHGDPVSAAGELGERAMNCQQLLNELKSETIQFATLLSALVNIAAVHEHNHALLMFHG